MADCNFSLPISGDPSLTLSKARSAVEKQGGEFNGDMNGGNFKVAVFGNTIAGSYSVSGGQMHIAIDEKPFLIPCGTIEGFLKSQIS